MVVVFGDLGLFEGHGEFVELGVDFLVDLVFQVEARTLLKLGTDLSKLPNTHKCNHA